MEEKELRGILKSIRNAIDQEPSNFQVYEDFFFVCKEEFEKNKTLVINWLKKLSDRLEKQIPLASTDEEARKFYQLHKNILLKMAWDNFDSYCLYIEWNREPKAKFYQNRRKQLKPLADALQRLADGKTKVLGISLPPGVGKLISDDTPVLTEKGWKNHGDLVVGDRVYGLDGKLKRVEHVFEKHYADYEVEFTNGEKIACHGNHEWVVFNRHKQKKEVLSTLDILKQGLKENSDFAFILPNRKKIYDKNIGFVKGLKRVAIKSIKPIEHKVGNCIQVEGGVYLVGKTMLPTHNSTLAIFFLTWLAGRNPMDRMLTGSHSNAFTRGAYDECLRIMTKGGDYLFYDVFPDAKIVNTNAKEQRIDLGESKRFETLQFTSIGSGNAGLYRATRLLYCDDLCSGIEVALSMERLDKLWDTYTTDLRQRKLGDDCAELHIATRWSIHDVIGRLERFYEGRDDAEFIRVPALNENDESNFDYPYGLGFTTEMFREQRNILDEATWNALYMNEPIEREGVLYNTKELRRFFDLPDRTPDAVLGICDTKNSGTDYAFLPVAYVYGDDYYIADCVCDNSLPEFSDPKLVSILLEHRVQMCKFESNNAGGRTAEKVVENLKLRNGITHIITEHTQANKETKIIVNSPWVKEHCLFLDESRYERNSDYGRMMALLGSYTTRGKNKFDDVPDGMAMLAIFAQSLKGNQVQVFKRPF